MFWSARKHKDIKRSTGKHDSVGLVIPCYNEEDQIIEKIQNSIEALSEIPAASIYVIDDGSTDATFRLAEDYKYKHRLDNLLVWKNNGVRGKAGALNWVFTQIENEIIVISDADAHIEKNAINHLIHNFNDPSIGAVTGKLVVRDKNNLSEAEEGLYRKISDMWRMGESNIDSCSIFNGPLMSFRRELSGKFEIDVNTYADDTCLAYKIRQLGYRTVYEPSAVVSEYISNSVLDRVRQEIRRARGLTKLVLKNASTIGKLGYYGQVIVPFSLFNYIISPIMTIILLCLLPFVVIQYPVLLLITGLLLFPFIRTAFFGYLYRQIALVIGLTTPSKGRWKPTRKLTPTAIEKNSRSSSNTISEPLSPDF